MAKAAPKPQKPRSDFPLFPHATGRWAKKVRQKLRYFGKITDDPKGEKALEKWLEQKDDLLAGRTPRVNVQGFTVADLCNRFLTAKRSKMASGELSPSVFGDYHKTCADLVNAFGGSRLVIDLDPGDFARLRADMARKWSPVSMTGEIQRVRVVFRYAAENRLIPIAVHFGSEFRRPSKTTLRLERAKKPLRMFEAAQLRKIIKAATVPMKAMILLGINCGFGNSDCVKLPTSAVDLKAGWVDYPRPKTGIPRRCPLWKETIAAVREAIAQRPKAKARSDAGLVFLTSRGKPWGKRTITEHDGGTRLTRNIDDRVCKGFRDLLRALKLHKPGLGFYALRHGFETVAGDSKDQVAVNAIMGHVDDSMASVYRERIDDERLQAVVAHVHDWLFGSEEKK